MPAIWRDPWRVKDGSVNPNGGQECIVFCQPLLIYTQYNIDSEDKMRLFNALTNGSALRLLR